MKTHRQLTKMDDVRSMSELPSLFRFFTTKREQFQFPSLDINGFEACICNGESYLFSDLVSRILRFIKKNKEIRIGTFEEHLRSFVNDINKPDIVTLVKTDIKTITPTDKLKILKWLADQTKEKNDIEDILQEEFGSDPQGDSIINVGQDSENRTYWYFDDLRLYRQKSGQSINKAGLDWQCVATNCQSWEELIQQFSQSKEEQEKELHTYLHNHLYPVIKPLLQSLPDNPVVISNEDLQRIESEQMDGKPLPNSEVKPSTPAVDQSELIKAENPELSKVLSEEPSTGRGTASNTNGDVKKSGGISFTQQQSQLFVFSTHMANSAADAVMSGAHKSILSYHLEAPDTKKFLQAHPMKVTIPTSQSRLPMPPQRTNPFRQPRSSAPQSQQPHMQYGAMRPGGPQPGGGYNPSMPNQQPGPGGRPMAGPMPGYMNNGMEGGMGGQNMSQPVDISKQMVPDANLTPDQRQRREKQLSSLRQIHQMLLADNDNGQPGSMQSMTDFKHMAMAGESQLPGMAPSGQMSGDFGQFGINQHSMGCGPMYGPPGGPPMSPATGNPGMMESKPPPPYPNMPMSSPSSEPVPGKKKAGRKRKNSQVPSPAPGSPHDQPPVKIEKHSIPPSPLANQNIQGGPVTPQSQPMSVPMHSGPRTPQQNLPMTPEEGRAAMSGPMRGMMQQQPPLGRQNSAPNFSRMTAPPNQNSFHMMQAGQPTPYQNTPLGGPGDAPPSYNVSLRRGMSVESITAPPSQRQQYLQPQNQERVIERQLNVCHQSMSSQSFSEQQSMYSSTSTTSLQQHHTSQPANSVAPGGDNSSNTLTNITSASLANLAKDVELNISEMSQKMSHGGPFADMQSAANPTNSEQNADQPNNSNSNIPTSTSQSQQQPSVNNTYVNAHLSIGQVNVQNVTANQSYQGPGGMHNMQQNVDVSMNNFSGAMPGGPQPDPMYKPPQPAPAAPAVSIQNKGRNTIQYLPVSQPSIAPSHDPVIPPKQSLDFMGMNSTERFPSPSPAGFMPPENPHMGGMAPHMRAPSSMYGGSHPGHPGGHMMTTAGMPPGGAHMAERPGAPYMMSAQQASLSMGGMGYNHGPGHPALMESHHMQMRSQHMMSAGPYPGHPGMPPGAPGGYGGPGGFPPHGGPPSSMHYGHPEFMPNPGGHPMAPRGPPMQQPMMMSHQGGPYMGGPPGGPPYM